MADIRPFKAVRPQEKYAAEVAALPYDVMSADEAREMVKGNPYSFLHVDKAEIDMDADINPYDAAVYENASNALKNLIADDILTTDEKPLLYIYKLILGGRSQTGLVACASVDEYLNGSIKKHELTREDKEQDRIRHVETCNAQTGPIFLTYRNDGTISGMINAYTAKNKPVYDFETSDSVRHIVWVIDGGLTDEIAEKFKSIPCLYIADGHHRNAAAVKAALKRRESGAVDGEFNYYLSVIFPHDELKIMDYNRLIKDLNGLTQEGFLSELAKVFEISEAGGIYNPEHRHTFGLYIGGKWYKLAVKNGIVNESDTVEALDVSILQKYVLDAVLGIKDPRTDKRIDFVGGIRGLTPLMERVDSGEMCAAFSMYPTSMEELMAVADEGKIMPPKSTWFEPKLRSGIFIHTL